MRWRCLAVIIGLAGCLGEGEESSGRCSNCPTGTLVTQTLVESSHNVTLDALTPLSGEPPWFAGTFDDSVRVGVNTLDPEIPVDGDMYVGRDHRAGFDMPFLAIAPSDFVVQPVGVAPDLEEGAIGVFYTVDQVGLVQVEASWLARDTREVRREVLATMSATLPRGVVASMTVDPHGWPIVVVSGTDVAAGENQQITGARTVVMRLGQGLRRQLLLSLPDAEVMAVTAAAPDTIVIGGRYSGFPPPGFPECLESYCAFVMAIDAGTADGEPVRWLRAFHAVGGAEVRALAGAPDGRVFALVEAVGQPIEPRVGNGTEEVSMWLADMGFDGFVTNAIPLATGPETLEVNGRALARTPDHTAVVAVSLTGTLTVRGMDFTSDAAGTHDGVVFEVVPGGGPPPFFMPIRSSNDIVLRAVAAYDNLVAVGGSFDRTLYLPIGAVSESPLTFVNFNGFLFELAR